MAYLSIHPSFEGCLKQQGLFSFAAFFAAAGKPIGNHASRFVSQVELGETRGYLKRERRTPWKDYFASWWAGFGFVSKSRREWTVLNALKERGIDCPEALAVGEDNGQAFLLIRELSSAVNLNDHLQHDDLEIGERNQLARTIGKALARFHEAGFTHPDIYAKHVFVDRHTKAVAFIDFQRTRRRLKVTWAERWRDVAALDASLSPELVSSRERFAFLSAYLRHAAPHAGRKLWRQSLWAVAQRTGHLLGRRKIQAMRRRAAA